MLEKKDIVFVMKVMLGGGAERVITVLCGAFAEKGYNVTLVVTHQHRTDAVLTGLDGRVETVFLEDITQRLNSGKLSAKLYSAKSKLANDADAAAILKYRSRNEGRINALKEVFLRHKGCTAIAFLNDPVFLTLLASPGVCGKVIISERGDPEQYRENKTTMAFIRREYKKADCMVCQSFDARDWYKNNSDVRTEVIFNPVKSGLPEPFSGEREKKIVNFCRISDQKNLLLLMEAFRMLTADFPEYELYIYGNAVGNGAAGYLEKVSAFAQNSGVGEKIHILPGRSDIHTVIRGYSMFVSSSDFEGMSNSMLEAMATGLPTVCTDCPAGGAKAVIKDHENGLLVPVGDAERLAAAMKEVIESPELAEKLSAGGVKIKEELSAEKTAERWEKLISG